MSSLPSIISLDHVVDAATAYNHGISDLFDKHAPIATKTVSIHPKTPWFNKNIALAKRERRQTEKNCERLTCLFTRQCS